MWRPRILISSTVAVLMELRSKTRIALTALVVFLAVLTMCLLCSCMEPSNAGNKSSGGLSDHIVESTGIVVELDPESETFVAQVDGKLVACSFWMPHSDIEWFYATAEVGSAVDMRHLPSGEGRITVRDIRVDGASSSDGPITDSATFDA